jgi:hypothetical protein
MQTTMQTTIKKSDPPIIKYIENINKNIEPDKPAKKNKVFFVRKSRSPPTKTKKDESFTQYDKTMNDAMNSPTTSPKTAERELACRNISRQEKMFMSNICLKNEDNSEENSPRISESSNLLDSGIIDDDDEPEITIDTNDIDFSPTTDICTHCNIIKDKGITICEDCGIELYEEISHEQEWRYFGDQDSRNATDPSRCQWRKSPEKGIKKDLENLRFPPDICILSDKLYMIITNGEIKRSDLRKGIMFACVFESYKIKGRARTPDEIQKRFFDLDRKCMSQGITYYRLKCPRDYFQYEDISAKHFIPKIMKMKQFNASTEHIDKVVLLYEKIKDACPVLNRSNPQSTSKAIIYYYFRRRGCMITASRFGKIVALSDIIVLRLATEISRVLGTLKTLSL